MASLLPSLRIEVTGFYKGGTRVWSNRHYFSGGVPADNTHWETLMDAVVLAFKACLTPNSTITAALGYLAGSDVAVHEKVYSTVGTYSLGSDDKRTPLQNAALVRWSTAARSTKNHPIYGFAYVHDVCYDDLVAGDDKLCSGQKTALQTFAGDWVSGFSDGTHTLVRATAQGHVATGSVVEEYLTHRDFPYQTSV